MPRKNSVKSDVGTKHDGNRSQTVRDSNNIIQADISGSGTIITINPPSKSDSVSKIKVSEVANVFTVLGRWLLEHLGINVFYAIIIISLISSGCMEISLQTTKDVPEFIRRRYDWGFYRIMLIRWL